MKNRQLSQENDVLKKKVDGFQISIKNYEAEVKRRFETYDQGIAQLNKDNDQLRRRLQQLSQQNSVLGDYEAKLALMSQEIERLHSNLNTLSQDNDSLKKQLYEKNSLVAQTEIEWTRKISILERDNDQL